MRKYDLKWLQANIDSGYVKEEPDTVVELIRLLIAEYYQMKDTIELQREKLLLMKAILSDTEEE